MSSPGSRRFSTPRRIFGVQEDSAADTDNEPIQREPNGARRVLSRISFGSIKRKPSFLSRIRGEEEVVSPPASERAPIPTMMQPSGEVYSTPLPVLSMIVLSITMLGEFLSANVATPFLLFMVKGFGEFENEADVAFWTGILVSTFFLTQFLTSILWATVAEKHGRRAVLMISLLGSALTCITFGTATTLQQAICIRLMQGIFAGAVGVARGSVAFVTDPTNEGRAYAILGFCWGFGGVAGAIIGGSFERPAVKWPTIFQDIPLFVTYPYLLPCGIAASITFTGSVLSCFLGRDGGPREGAIRLFPEKQNGNHSNLEEESAPPSPVFEEPEHRGFLGFRNKLSHRFSGYFASRAPAAYGASSNDSSPAEQPAVPMSSPNQVDRQRTFSKTSRANGSAYGYSGSYRRRLASNATLRRGSVGSTLRRRRSSNHDASRGESGGEDLNFAQRLLMANQDAVTNIADLWVAAAMNVDNEDPFETDTDSDLDDDEAIELGESAVRDEDGNELLPVSATPTGRGRRYTKSRRSTPSGASPFLHPSSGTSGHPKVGSPQGPSTSQQVHRPSFSHSIAGTSTSRRFSTNVPSIFSHSGVRTPPAVLDAQQLLTVHGTDNNNDMLDTIQESRHASQATDDIESLVEKQPSLASQLPIVVIVQYGVLALHTTTHDQVFMSYLVSDFSAGGLNLNAGNFAQLIALMCLAQIAYQFYLYPNIGPPRGRFSHLAMFRIGSFLFIPAYLSVVLYRAFASAKDDASIIVMSGLALSTAVRFCGQTFCYTAISILLNYMTPPSAVGYANGIAQSIVSLARCVGPVIGGSLWSASVQDGPSGYYFGFVVCAGVCALTILQSLLIR